MWVSGSKLGPAQQVDITGVELSGMFLQNAGCLERPVPLLTMRTTQKRFDSFVPIVARCSASRSFYGNTMLRPIGLPKPGQPPKMTLHRRNPFPLGFRHHHSSSTLSMYTCIGCSPGRRDCREIDKTRWTSEDATSSVVLLRDRQGVPAASWLASDSQSLVCNREATPSNQVAGAMSPGNVTLYALLTLKLTGRTDDSAQR